MTTMTNNELQLESDKWFYSATPPSRDGLAIWSGQVLIPLFSPSLHAIEHTIINR